MSFDKQPVENFIGKGIILPLEIQNGRPPLRTGFDLIRSSLRIILTWPKYTRFYLMEFGTELGDQIEEPNDPILANAIKSFATDSIAQWEHRIQLQSVDVIQDQTSISLSINYKLINSQTVDNCVFPFYEKYIP